MKQWYGVTEFLLQAAIAESRNTPDVIAERGLRGGEEHRVRSERDIHV